MFNAVFLITIGTLLLTNNFGYISWEVWQGIFSYWPVLIIFAGVNVICGRTKTGDLIAGIINSIIFLLIIAKVIGFNLPFANPMPLPKNNFNAPQFLFTETHYKYNFN